MLDFLPAPLKGALVVLFILLNTLVFLPFLVLFAIIKLIIPVTVVRTLCTRIVNFIAWYWIGYNNTLINVFHKIEWDIRGAGRLGKKNWTFETSTTQTWTN